MKMLACKVQGIGKLNFWSMQEMPLVQSARFESVKAKKVAFVSLNPEGNNKLLLSAHVKASKTNVQRAKVRILDSRTMDLLEEIQLTPDGSGGSQLSLYVVEGPSNPFLMELINERGEATGFITIVYPVSMAAIETLNTQFTSSTLQRLLPRREELPPLSARGKPVSLNAARTSSIEPIYRRTTLTVDVPNIIPSQSSDMIRIM